MKPEKLKKIAEAMGKKCSVGIYTGKLWTGNEYVDFNPLKNAEQWIECLMWFRSELKGSKGGSQVVVDFWLSTESREALLEAILEFIGDIDEQT